MLLCVGQAHATAVGAQIPAPRDVPYPGVIQLQVDATDLDHRAFRVREIIPVAVPGRTTLLYPKWLPGNHSTTGPIDKLAGLIVHGNTGERLEWQRDPVEMYAFHVDVPAGVTQLELEFQFLTPTDTSQWRVVMTPDLLGLRVHARGQQAAQPEGVAFAVGEGGALVVDGILQEGVAPERGRGRRVSHDCCLRAAAGSPGRVPTRPSSAVVLSGQCRLAGQRPC
jgi:hypothetical protein